ncbi:MAG: CapA family protein [Firmicutes bacterium]|nr:CapA family protein [Bacillota bacterium]
MRRWLVLILIFLLSACVVEDEPEPPPVEPVTITFETDYRHPHVYLTLSEPESANEIVRNLTITPKVEYSVENEQAQISIVLHDWDYETEYTLTVAPFASKKQALPTEYVYKFETVPSVFKLVAVGDVMPAILTEKRVNEYDPGYPLAKIRERIKSGDLVFGNLEAPISDVGNPMDKAYVFRAKPFTIEVLLDGGFNLVSLANNHILDYGAEAMLDTIDLLDQHGIAHAGAGKDQAAAGAPVLREVNGVKVAMLAYTGAFPARLYPAWQAGPDTPGTAFYYDEDRLVEAVKSARELADVVIVSMHWGYEYTYATNAEQHRLGKLVVDSGADLVLGHHSHTPQGIEFYGGKPIVYSLGNFLFYPFATQKLCNETYILEAEINKDGVQAMSLVPVLLGDSQPFVPEGEELERMHELLTGLLGRYDTPWAIDGERVVISLDN